MKKIKITLGLIMLISIANAQIFVEFAPNFSFSTNNYIENGKSITVDYGVGANLVTGYSINKKIDFSCVVGVSKFPSAITDYTIYDANIKGKYYFLQNYIKPYISLGIGYYEKSFKSFNAYDQRTGTSYELTFPVDKGIGFNSSIGISFQSKKITNLNINTELSYCNVYTETSYNLINVSVGVLYYFNNKKSNTTE